MPHAKHLFLAQSTISTIPQHPDITTTKPKSPSAASITSNRRRSRKTLRSVIGRLFGGQQTTPVPGQPSPTLSYQPPARPAPSPPLALTRSLEDRLYDGQYSPSEWPVPAQRQVSLAQSPYHDDQDLEDNEHDDGFRDPMLLLESRRSSMPSQFPIKVGDDGYAAIGPTDVTGTETSMTADGIGGTSTKRRSRSLDELQSSAAVLRTYRQLEDEKNYWRRSYAQSFAESSVLPARTDESLEQDAESFKECHSQQYETTDLRIPDAHESEAESVLDEQDGQDDAEDARLVEQEHRLRNAHDSPVMGERDAASTTNDDVRIQSRIVKLEQMMSAFQQPLEALAKNAQRKSVTFDTSESRRSTRQQHQYQQQQQQQQQQQRQPSTSDSGILFVLNLINDERARRHSLERQVRILQQDLAEMRFQLSQPIMSRNSRVYMPYTVRQRHASTHSRASHISAYEPSHPTRLTSRFSGSESLTESEAARMHRSLDATSLRDVAGEGEGEGEGVSTPITPFEISSDPVSRWKQGELDMF